MAAPLPVEPTLRAVERGKGRALAAAGDWTVYTLSTLRRPTAAAAGAVKAIDLSDVTRLDTAGALALVGLARDHGGCGFDGARPEHASLIELVGRSAPPAGAGTRARRKEGVADTLAEIGEEVVGFVKQAGNLLGFFGEVLVVMARGLVRPARLRPGSIVAQMNEVWIRAMPIVGVLTFLIGVVTAYQGVEQLKQFGAEAFTVEAVGIGMLRELGVLLTAIIVAGRSGSAFTAQLGTMKVNLELDAMRTMALDPVEWLVVPRIVALTLSMPLLVFFADLMGVLGGAFACTIYLDFTLVQFFDRMRDTVGIWHFWVGMIKAPVFAFVIAAIGCYEGLQVGGSADSVGRQTTRSVVEAIFLVIVLDAIFSVIFLLAGV